MGDTDHVGVDWLSLITEVKEFTGPCPCRVGLWNFQRVCRVLSLQANFLIMSFLSTSSACCFYSFAVLCLLVSSFSTSIAGVRWQWRSFVEFSTGSGSPVGCLPLGCLPLSCLPLHLDCGFFPFLVFVDLPYWM